MGRLLNEQDIVKKNVHSFVERSVSEYSRFLDGAAPSFVTYYRKNLLKSTTDLGLENAEKILGANSPVSFDKVENLPIFGIDPFNLSLEKEEIGAQTSISGEGIISPNTIKPLPDDYFSIDYIGNKYLFKVVEAQPDRIDGKKFYKINFTFSKILDHESDVIEQIREHYVCILTNIGTDHKAILPKDDYLNLQYLEEVYMTYFKFYSNNFYDRRYNLFTMKSHRSYLYNQLMYEFSTKTEIFKPFRSFLNDFYIEDPFPKDSDFYNRYRDSIYYALEKQTTKNLKCMKGFLQPIDKKYTQFRYAYQSFVDITFIPHEVEGDIAPHLGCHLMDDFTFDFFNRIHGNDHYLDNETYLFENIIISYLNKSIVLTEEMLDLLSDVDLFPEMRTYLFIPIILFILRFLRNRILNKID